MGTLLHKLCRDWVQSTGLALAEVMTLLTSSSVICLNTQNDVETGQMLSVCESETDSGKSSWSRSDLMFATLLIKKSLKAFANLACLDCPRVEERLWSFLQTVIW